MPIEHWDLAAIFNWDPFQYQITKYAMRWRDKGGIADLEKCLHFVQKYIEVEKLRAEGKLTITLLQEALNELKKETREGEESEDQKPCEHVWVHTGLGEACDNCHIHSSDPRVSIDNRPDIYGGKRGGPLGTDEIQRRYEGESYRAMDTPTGEQRGRT